MPIFMLAASIGGLAWAIWYLLRAIKQIRQPVSLRQRRRNLLEGAALLAATVGLFLINQVI